MIPAIIGLILLLVLILIAIRLISLKRPPTEDQGNENISVSGKPIIHASGIYSIVRKSPREDLLRIRPQEADLRKYIASINEDIYRRPLSAADKQVLLDRWNRSIEENIAIVEKGDSESVEFYYLESSTDKPCPVCAQFFKKGQFVMRQEIYKSPSVIPPFHLGCVTMLAPYAGKEKLRETTTLRIEPLFARGTAPALPDWEKTVAP